MASEKIPKKEEEKIKDEAERASEASWGEAERSEMEWIKACEAELNFQKAVDMATGFLPIKSEEDFKFMKKWIFL